MPRAALLSIHARVEGTLPTALEDPSVVQLWGPRFSAYVVAEADIAVFTLGRLPDDGPRRQLAEDLAARLRALLDGTSMTYLEAGRALGVHPNQLRYAAPTGTVLLKWDGARAPVIWTVPPPQVDPSDARLELVRRYLHVFGPGSPESFAQWAGIRPRRAVAAFDVIRGELTAVQTPIGECWILTSDEDAIQTGLEPAASLRLLPSGDTYLLLQGDHRSLLVPDPDRRASLWPPRVWPGGLLVNGEIRGTWRRTMNKVTIETWESLSRKWQDAIEEEAASLPIPDVHDEIEVSWAG